MRTQQPAKPRILVDAQIHQRAAIGHLERHVIVFEPAVHRSGQRVAFDIDGFPEEFRLGFEEPKHFTSRRHHQRVTHEGSGKEGYRRFGEAFIAIGPLATIKRVHEPRLARDHADGHAAPGDFAIGHQISFDIVVALRAARAEPEAGHHLIENEQGAVAFGDPADLADEIMWAEFGAAALHRLDHHSGQTARVPADVIQRLRCAIGQNHHVLHRVARHTRRDRHAARAVLAVDAAHQNLVEIAVVIAGEKDDLVAPGDRAGQTHGGIDGFGPGADKAGAVIAGDLAEQVRRLHRQQVLRADLEPFVDLVMQGRDHPVRRMAQETRAKTVQDVDIFIAIHIQQARAFGFHRDDLIDKVLPQPVESRCGARVRMGGAVFLRQRFRPRCLGVEPRHQPVDMGLLTGCQSLVLAGDLGHRCRDRHGLTRRL